MYHARLDYNRIQDPEGKIPEDEPVFLLRAQDHLAVLAVLYYAQLCVIYGVPGRNYNLAMKTANLMKAWPKKKKPDIPDEYQPPLDDDEEPDLFS